MSAGAFRAYNQTRVNSASPGELLSLLYNAGIRHTSKAAQLLDGGDTATANTHLLKAQEIIAEMIASLDLEVDLAKNLLQLYEFCHHQLVEANVSKSSKGVPEVVGILKELRDAWEEALHAQNHADQAVSAGTGGNRRAQGGISFAH